MAFLMLNEGLGVTVVVDDGEVGVECMGGVAVPLELGVGCPSRPLGGVPIARPLDILRALGRSG